MSKKKRDLGSGIGDQKKEKPIFGSGADVQQMPKDNGFVKCVCTVACAWKGYHDEGDKVFIKRELIEKDSFIKVHFKTVEPLPEGRRSQSGEEGADETGTAGDGEGTQSQATEHNDNGEDGTAAGEGEAAADADGSGQGELELK